MKNLSWNMRTRCCCLLRIKVDCSQGYPCSGAFFMATINEINEWLECWMERDRIFGKYDCCSLYCLHHAKFGAIKLVYTTQILKFSSTSNPLQHKSNIKGACLFLISLKIPTVKTTFLTVITILFIAWKTPTFITSSNLSVKISFKSSAKNSTT
jgi:hypothetical protein